MAPELKSYEGWDSTSLPIYWGSEFPTAQSFWNPLIRISCPLPFTPWAPEISCPGYSGAVLPVWTPPPSLRGARGIHLGTPGSPLNYSQRGSARTSPQPSLGCPSGNEGIAQELGWGLFKAFLCGFREGDHFNIIGVCWRWGVDLCHKVPVCVAVAVSWSVCSSLGSSCRQPASPSPSWALGGVTSMMSSIN